MITERDWQEITAKCQAVSKPNENAYLLLAAATYMSERGSTPNVHTSTGYSGDSEFANVVSGKNPVAVMKVFEELMDTIGVLSPKLHNAVMDKLRNI